MEGMPALYEIVEQDNICALAKTKEEMKLHNQTVLQQLTKLGFLINYEKSDLEQKHTQEFLSFAFNINPIKISVPQAKLAKLTTKTKQWQKTMTYS
ncbi:hypothetical protein G6F37_011355 [Rhizopus arrhizus]|nr:hypothetical protein G6F38_010591 [Rhizopus arrhizus]KAG1149731.1 hypothetical protein G6F37_011355 [Rhizopus arrhizus]